MTFRIRPVQNQDFKDLQRLASLQSTHGFLTLRSEGEGLSRLMSLSIKSFKGQLRNPDEGKYLFVLEDTEKSQVIGTSLIIARHGTPPCPHVYFEMDPVRNVLKLEWETTGRTEIGGLILDHAYRGHPEKLGKRLSYARLYYIGEHSEKFQKKILAELLPPFTVDGKSSLWEALGHKLTGMTYLEADQLCQKEKEFIYHAFPKEEILISSLPVEVQKILGVAGSETKPVVKILTEVGFHYLNQIDPFDGGPHYGATQDEILQDRIKEFLFRNTKVEWEF